MSTDSPPESSRSGVLLVHKPVGPTSRQVVDQAQIRLPDRKMGHGGTLDPRAEGLLPVLVEEATKLVPYLHERPKTYRVRCRFDYASDTLDLGGDYHSLEPSGQPDLESLQSRAASFVGDIQQVPPQFAAVRENGERLYRKARRGETVDPEPRQVTCHSLSVLRYRFPVLDLEVTCGKGFYVRSLVRDLARDLGLEGSIITVLVRTRYGPFHLDQAQSLEDPRVDSLPLHSMRRVVSHLPTRTCTAGEIRRLSHGDWLDRDADRPDSRAAAVGPDDRLYALLEATTDRGPAQWRPRRVLNRKTPLLGPRDQP